MVRTVEQILGIHPMNDKDSAATPRWYTAFTSQGRNYTAVQRGAQPDLADRGPEHPCRPAVPTSPRGRPRPRIAASTAVAREHGSRSPRQWGAVADEAAHDRARTPVARLRPNPEQMKPFTFWYQTSDWKKPYPGDSKIYAPEPRWPRRNVYEAVPPERAVDAVRDAFVA